MDLPYIFFCIALLLIGFGVGVTFADYMHVKNKW